MATEHAALEAAEVDSDIALMLPGELVRVILDASSAQRLIERAVELLAERDNWYYLLEALERLCKSGEPRRQVEGIGFVRRVGPSANDWFRRQCRALLLELVDRRNRVDVIDAALAALGETATV